MSGAVETAGRITRRTSCPVHFVEFGQTYLAKTQEHDSVWLPVGCAKCEAELRDKIRADEELSRQTEETEAETDRRAAADAQRAARIEEATNRSMAQEAANLLAEFYGLHREKWPRYEDGHGSQRNAGGVTEGQRWRDIAVRT